MEDDLIYWRHPTLPGIKVEEVSGGVRYKGAVWREAAAQIYCENGRDEYREIGHFASGAPFIYGEESRISISHCNGLYVVATLAPVPGADLSQYSDVTALGVDAEPRNRSQVMKVRERFLSDAELAMTGEDEEMNVLAWTVKEACYKAALCEGLDFRDVIAIERLPKFGPPVPVYDPADYDYDGSGRGFSDVDYGQATVKLPDGSVLPFIVFSYLSDDVIVTLAYSEKSSRFGKKC